jgi:hypothetical protein
LYYVTWVREARVIIILTYTTHADGNLKKIKSS